MASGGFSPVVHGDGMFVNVVIHQMLDIKHHLGCLEDQLPVRFQLQLHKFIWPPDTKGV